MFDLMEAIRQKQTTQSLSPADFAKTAETAQPRTLELAENLRETADFSAAKGFSATIRKNPQPFKTGNTPAVKGYRDFSANPQNPQALTEKEKQSPDAVLMELAQKLGAEVHMLKHQLSEDCMQAIAEGAYTPAYLMAHFQQMDADGIRLTDLQWRQDQLALKAANRRSQKPDRDSQWKMEWQAAFELFLTHIMGCSDCCGRVGRYCGQGAKLGEEYNAAYTAQSETTESYRHATGSTAP